MNMILMRFPLFLPGYYEFNRMTMAMFHRPRDEMANYNRNF